MSASCCDQMIVQKGEPEQAMLNLKQQWSKIAARLRRWQATAEQRRQLRLLVEDTDFLKDIGVSEGDATVEANKPFWEE